MNYSADENRQIPLPFSAELGVPTDDSRNLPTSSPMDRLLSCGRAALSDNELLTLLIGSATESIADRLLQSGGLEKLLQTDGDLLLQIPGMDQAKVAAIQAAVELATRIARGGLRTETDLLNRPAAAARFLHLRYGRLDQEVMGAVFVDMRNRVIRTSEFFRGTLTRAAVEPRCLMREGVSVGAAGLMLFHTHPSGDPAPSPEDLNFTRRMVEACELIGIRLLDHLIIGHQGSWVSLKQRGGW